MRLAHGLMVRFLVIAIVCLAAASSWSLISADRELARDARDGAEFVARQLELQLLLGGIGGTVPVPIWKPIADDGLAPGLCVRYRPAAPAAEQSLCKGWSGRASSAPAWFGVLYGWLFDPSHALIRPIGFRGERQGLVLVAADPAATIAAAWSGLRRITGVTFATVGAATLLIIAAIGEALRPSRRVQAALRRMAGGDLTVRLPSFRMQEFRTIALAFNTMADRLQRAEAERIDLTRRLFQAQEDERRHLARELHDAFGQNLAAIMAFAASIGAGESRESELSCGAGAESRAIGRIAKDMMASLHNALEQLRPPELEELGLVASLQGLIASWNGSCGGRTVFRLEVAGDFCDLPPSLALSVYRIAQEGLTNAARHACAREVMVSLARRPDGPRADERVDVAVEDDGEAPAVLVKAAPRLGLLGIEERVAAFGGRLELARTLRGFRLAASLPLTADRGPTGAAA